MFCSKCGKETTENAAFCAGCGASLAGGQQPKKRILSTIAGIVEIVAGGFTVLTAIVCLIAMFVAEGLPGWYVFFPVAALVIISALAIVGGICALRRKHWALALTGAIVVIWPTVVLGIAAVVLNIMARDEFER